MDGLLIGRFQPFHLGHLDALHYALTKVENLWIGLGSSNRPIQKSNPFTADERKDMIISSIDNSISKRIKIFNIPDIDNHQKWVELIDTIVPKFDMIFTNDDLTKHLYSKKGVIVESIPFTQRDVLSGTNIRDLINYDQPWTHLVPKGTLQVLNKINVKDRLKIL